MKFGTNEIQKVYLGTTELDGLYFGTNEAYSKSGGIDEYTLGVWHLENNTNNAVEGSSEELKTTTLVYSTEFKKFGEYGARFNVSSGNKKIVNAPTGDFTFDCWIKTLSSSASDTSNQYIYPYSANYPIVRSFKNKIRVQYAASSTTDPYYTDYAYASDTWVHVAFEQYGNNLNTYIDGHLSNTKEASTTGIYFNNASSSYYAFFDEIRLSNVARYQGQDFTPPTQPY